MEPEDIPLRLREHARKGSKGISPLLFRAADTIERLEREAEKLREEQRTAIAADEARNLSPSDLIQ